MSTITKDKDGNILECCIDLDPAKVFAAIAAGNVVLGKPKRYWVSLLADHAQSLSDEATPDQYDDWGIEALGYDL